ncbi:MAG: Trm112 family protein [Pseudomonadota bacterium]
MADEINPALLDMLVCPFTKSALTYDKANGELISPRAGLAFPIRDGIPMLCSDAARQLTDAEQDALDAQRKKTPNA